MRLKCLKSKLHLATVTRSELHYHGSLTIDPELMEAVGLFRTRRSWSATWRPACGAETYILPGNGGLGRSS